MNLPQIHERALRATGTVGDGVAARQLELATPCDRIHSVLKSGTGGASGGDHFGEEVLGHGRSMT